jgi:hypothetical protein
MKIFIFLESLFHQILVRTIKWAQLNHASSPKLYYRRGKFILDDQHLLILTASSMKYARMKVQIIRNNPNSNTNNTTTTTPNNNNNSNTKPSDEINPQLVDPTIVAKVSFYKFHISRSFFCN